MQTCCWKIVERTQPESIPAELHRFSPFRKKLARRHWRGWSPGQSQGYGRTTRRRIEHMQSEVARMLRESGGSQFGETELEEELLEGLRQRNFPEEVIEEQGKRFARATRFIPDEYKKKAKKERERDGNGKCLWWFGRKWRQ